jgi:hypothetical protein
MRDHDKLIIGRPTAEDITIGTHLEQIRTDMKEQILFWTDPENMKAADDKSQRQKEFRDIVYGVGQVVVWPFVLAIGLALRITKVTIEVRKWAVD